MAFSFLATGATTVTTGATKIYSTNEDAEMRAINNGGTNTLFIGNSGVTSANGFPIAPAGTLQMTAGDFTHAGVYNGEMWAVVTTGTNAVRTMESQ